MNDVKYCLALVRDPSSFHSRSKKILNPSDIKGMKIRPPHATFANLITELDGTNIQSSAPEVRDVLEKVEVWSHVYAPRHARGST